MTKVLNTLPHPALTVSGKTAGPAVAIGRSKVGRGHPLYLHHTELRQAVIDMGWPTPELHEKLTGQLAAAHARVVELERTVADQADAVKAAEHALAARFAHPAKPAAAKRPAAKETD